MLILHAYLIWASATVRLAVASRRRKSWWGSSQPLSAPEVAPLTAPPRAPPGPCNRQIKGGFVWSGAMGVGIVVVRRGKAGWSAPSSVGTAGVGFGLQARAPPLTPPQPAAVARPPHAGSRRRTHGPL